MIKIPFCEAYKIITLVHKHLCLTYFLTSQINYYVLKFLCKRKSPENKAWNKKERETGLEPATPTLARSYSTNWATRAYNYYINTINTCKDVYSKLPTKLHFSLSENFVWALVRKYTSNSLADLMVFPIIYINFFLSFG